MARGKHKVGAEGRRTSHLNATLEQLRTELSMEQEALAEAERALAIVDQLRGDMAAQSAAIADEISPYAGGLRREVSFLRSVFADASGFHSRILDAWDHYAGAAIDASPGSTGVERIEALNQFLGLQGWLSTIDIADGKGWSTEQVTRLQRARGERRNVSSDTARPGAAFNLDLLLDLRLGRPSFRQNLLDQGVVFVDEDGAHHVTDTDRLSPEQRSLLDAANHTAARIWASRATDLDPNAIHAWGAGSILVPDGEHGASLSALGATKGAITVEAREIRQDAIDPPLASTPAARRRSIATQSADSVFEAWRSIFITRRRVAENLGLPTHPFAPVPTHPFPSQGLASQNTYAAAAFSRWLADSNGSAYAETAVGLTAAATYWLPAGQTASFAESEPLDDADRAELVLPFPQVFLAFAEPLVLDPIETIELDDAKNWRLLSEVTHDTSRSNKDLTSVMYAHLRFSHDDRWIAPPLGDAIAQLGAQVEGLLLLADSFGRPEDLFAWCISIPALYGSTLGRFVVPASRSTTAYRDVVDNLTAVVAWAQWHEPDDETAAPFGITPADLEALVTSKDFRRNGRRSGAGVRVVDVGATHRSVSASTVPGDGASDFHVSPHIRRGHWRRQRYGAGREQIKRIRIAPRAGQRASWRHHAPGLPTAGSHRACNRGPG
ncbi:hypothetical protein [Leifsonia sp. P73]|uniref:hypothetical protein n=1 Tax=Leifsonia sp. P73 TaxID=3423959 RepID=UPI003DA37486